MTGGLVPDFVRNSILAITEARSGFGQCQGRALGVGVIRSVAPGGDRKDALVFLSRFLELTSVHVNAKATVVDLARAQVDELTRCMGHVIVRRRLVFSQ